MRTEAHTHGLTTPPHPDSDAAFLGWQDSLSGDIFPLYTITVEDHPLFHSTVSDVSLRRMRLRIPRTPSPYPQAGPSPWHDLGIELNHPKTAREAIETARRACADSAGGRKSDAGDRAGPAQDDDAFAFFDALVEEQEAVYETAGVLGLGDRVWILAKLPGFIKVHHKDIVDKYLLLTSSHDGTSHARVTLTPIRAVCNNSLTSTFEGAGDVHIRPPHPGVPASEQAVAVLKQSHALYEQLDVIFNGMAAKKISAGELRDYVQALVPDNEEKENDPRTEEMRNRVLQLHDSGQGANLARGTLWGAFNSVTEYTDYMMSGGDSTDRLDSIWFGRGEQLKLKAFHLAEQMLRV